MRRAIVLALVACKSPAPVPIAVANAAVDASEPPTSESVHVEVSRALRRWVNDPKDRSLYAKDFAGRAEPDARVEPVGVDAWIASLPATSKIGLTDIRTWLDPNIRLPAGESKTHVAIWYDGKSDYREVVWKREDGEQRLVRIKTNSRDSKEAAAWRAPRNFYVLDATTLATQLAAWIRTEGDLAWLVIADDKSQSVADLWPAAGSRCAHVDPPPAGALAQLRCTGPGDGQDFTVVRDNDTVFIRLTPAGRAAPMTTDRVIELPARAKLTFQAAP